MYLLAAEVLAIKIRQDNMIKGINFGTEFKLNEFADDTSAFLNSLTSAENLVQILNDYEEISGFKLNPSKAKAIWLSAY